MVSLFESIFKTNVFSEQQTLILYLTAMGCSILISLFYDAIRFRVAEGYIKKIFDVMLCILISIPFASVLGNRANSVGYDTRNYVVNYMKYGSVLENIGGGELGYVLLMKIIYFLSKGSVTTMLFTFSLLTIFLIVYSLSKTQWKGALPLGLFMYYATCGLNLGDQSRQLLAIAIIMYALSFLKNERISIYIVLCLIAMTIHLSSCIGLALLFIRNIDTTEIDMRKFIFYSCFIMAFLLLIAPQVFYLFLPDRYKYLIDQIVLSKSVGTKWILDTMPIVIAMLITNYLSKSKELSDRLPWFVIPFRLGGYASYFIMRLYYYPHVLGIYSTVHNYAILENKKEKRIVLIVIFILFGMYFYFNNVVYNEHNMMNYSRRIIL